MELRGDGLVGEATGSQVGDALRSAVLRGVVDGGAPDALQPFAFDVRDDVFGARDLVTRREDVDFPGVCGVRPAGVVVVVADRLGEQALRLLFRPQRVVLPLGAKQSGGGVVAQGGLPAEEVVGVVEHLTCAVGALLDLAVGVVGRGGGAGVGSLRIVSRPLMS